MGGGQRLKGGGAHASCHLKRSIGQLKKKKTTKQRSQKSDLCLRVDVRGGLKQFNIHFRGEKQNMISHMMLQLLTKHALCRIKHSGERERERSGKLFKVLYGDERTKGTSPKKKKTKSNFKHSHLLYFYLLT